MIPANWVAESTQEDRSIDPPAYYPRNGFFQVNGIQVLLVGLHRDVGQYDFIAQGKFGQIIYVSPQAGLIIVRNGEQEGMEDGEGLIYQFASARGESLKRRMLKNNAFQLRALAALFQATIFFSDRPVFSASIFVLARSRS